MCAPFGNGGHRPRDAPDTSARTLLGEVADSLSAQDRDVLRTRSRATRAQRTCSALNCIRGVA
jgi:hypothetical protein